MNSQFLSLNNLHHGGTVMPKITFKSSNVSVKSRISANCFASACQRRTKNNIIMIMVFPGQDWLVKMPGYPPKNLSSKLL